MTTDPREALCPYPGLEAFTADNRHYFFGRGRDTQLLISNLYASSLTVVYGSSGVGKTSVILAGVVPEVEREGDAVILVHRTWQDAARARSLGARMAHAVARRMGEPAIEADAPLDVLAERLARRWRRPIFLVFDQFEEYFLHNEPSDAPDSLDGELARLINRRDIEVNVMIVVREDSLAALDRFRHRVPTLLNNLYRLEHLTPGEARSAIQEPLAVLRQRMPADDLPVDDLPVEVEEGLASTILDDLAALDPSAQMASSREERRVELPFLQVVLERIWIVECRARSPVVRRKTFADAGGSRGIVRQRIAESLNALDAEEQRIVASALRHLVTPSGAKIALTMGDLAGYAGVTPDRVGAVIERLIGGGARVLRRVAHPTGDPALTKYEIYHDALGAPLLAWRLEMDRRRDEVERKARQRVQNSIAGLTLMVIAAIGIAVFLQRGKSRVEARELASIATGQLETDNGRAMLLALEAIKRNSSENAGDVVLRRALFAPGERLQDTVSIHVARLTVSPDGRYVVATDPQGPVAMWTTDSLRRIALPSSLRFARGASFDSSSRRVLIVDSRNPVVIDLDSALTVSRLPHAIGSVPTGHLLRDGNRALISYAGSGVIEWTRTDSSSWTETARTPSGELAAKELALSPDERWVAWVSEGKATLIDMNQRPWRSRRLSLGEERVSDVVFSSNSTLAVASNSKQVRVFSLATGAPERVVALACAVTRIAFSGGEAAGACTDGGFVRFNLPELSQQRMGEEPPLVNRPGQFTDLAISADGRYTVGLGAGDPAPTVWSTFNRTEATRLRGHRGDVTAFAFLPDSRHVISVGADSTIRKWEIVSAAQQFGDGEFFVGLARVALNDSATKAGIAGGPYGVQLWDLQRGARIIEEGVGVELPAIAVSPKGDRIATLDSKARVIEFSTDRGRSGITVWSPAPGDSAKSLERERRSHDAASMLRYAGRGDTLILSSEIPGAGGVNGSALVRFVRGVNRGHVLSRFDVAIEAMDVDSSGSLVVVGLADGRVHVRSLRGDTNHVELEKHAGGATAVAFGRGGLVASGGKEGDVLISSRRQASSMPNAGSTYQRAIKLGTHDRAVVRLVFDRTGTVLASGDEAGTTRLWNTTGRKELCSLEGEHADFIRAIAFSPSGKTVATADERGVALWFVDAAGLSCSFGYRLADLESPTEAMRFAPDGSALVIVGGDGVIRRYLRTVWAPRDSLMTWAAQRLRGRTLSAAERARYAKAR